MPNKNGLHLITPTSIASTGTGNSSSINTNGSVTFSTCATLSLRGIFNNTYDNYMMVIRHSSSSLVPYIRGRLLVGSTEAQSNYVFQELNADGTSITGSRNLSQTYLRVCTSGSEQRSGAVFWIYGPNLAQPTAYRSVVISGYSNAYIQDVAGTHSDSTAYDGLTLSADAGTFDGLIGVYGMRN